LIKLSARLPLITAERGIPSLFTAHDFWALCQRVYLHDWRKQACPGPQRGGDCYRCVTSGTFARHVRTVAVSSLRTFIPYPIRLRLRRLLAKDDYFLPDMQATPKVLEQRFALFREALLAPRHIIVPSQFVKDMLVRNGYPDEAIVVLPLGMQRPAAISSGGSIQPPVRLAFVGSLLPWKGTEILIQAFKQSRSQDLRLRLYGREDIIPAFSRQLRRLAQGDSRITFAGPFQPDCKDTAYADIDVLVIPSTAHESFSLVAREALLRGKPVIASSIGALPEVIVDGVNGFLVPPGDTAALTAVLDRIALDPALLTRLQIPGPVSVLTVEGHLARLEQLYATALAR
jgi:glycosyltransferase involved in cell wall biosynthesis